MRAPRTYTLSELEARSGFDKRTIAYYVQESLLPKVGRRGRRTRYSEEFLDRLMFIRRVRDLQDAGGLRAVTLSEIRGVIASQSEEDTRHLSRKGVSEGTLRELFAEPDLDTSEFAVAAEHLASFALEESLSRGSAPVDSLRAARSSDLSASMRRESMSWRSSSHRETESPRAAPSPPQSASQSEPELQTLLQDVERRARVGAKQSKGRTSEHLTRVPITEDIILSVRNIKEKDVHLVERLAAFLRKVGRLD